jgi:hypothetical protein
MSFRTIALSFFALVLTTWLRAQSVSPALPDSAFSLSASSDSTSSADSLLREIRALMGDLDIRQSMFSVSMGIGNRLYSMRNDGFNAQQSTLNQFAATPMVAYVHKTGLGVSGMAYIRIGDGKLTPYQYALSPSYDRVGKGDLAYGVSYTHYFTRDDLEFYTTPLKDEIYGYVYHRKSWLEPGLSFGWAGGSYREVRTLDTVILGVRRHIVDTMTVKLQDITLMASLSHSFDWDDVLTKGDGISLEPRISLISGATHMEQQDRVKVLSGRNLQRVRFRSRSQTGNTGFQVQSLAFSMSASYIIGKWSFSPQYYVGYYFQSEEKPFTHLFSLVATVLF